MSRKNQISYVKQAEPSFLKDFKKRAGYKEGPTVEDKKRELPPDDRNDQEDRPDERPQIVALKSGDLTEAEVEAMTPRESEPSTEETTSLADVKSTEGTSEYATGDSSTKEETDVKVVFRKPEKRPPTDGIDASSASKKAKQESVMEKVSNKRLLSFDQDDEE
ncbi:hypothetical protein RvY_15891 [Ramazzottius varieornatus]|uniref:DUF4604 domain-containing protein n=1 Tax=Ramazzottius varieornatus TaxID=947166 RepID=A0A1D1VXX8_RAMVA|nr:hypothetical protein RvY_15891 [Ramazzottius varieornatus]